MKTLKNSDLIWEFSKKKISLKSGSELIVQLNEETASRSTFLLNGVKHVIQNEGLWISRTAIKDSDKTILCLRNSFLGNKGNVEFANGARYECKVSNTPLVSLSFFTLANQEVLRYKLDPAKKPRVVMQILPNSVNESELLMLIILGCFAFEGITRENTETDFITLVAGAS